MEYRKVIKNVTNTFCGHKNKADEYHELSEYIGSYSILVIQKQDKMT